MTPLLRLLLCFFLLTQWALAGAVNKLSLTGNLTLNAAVLTAQNGAVQLQAAGDIAIGTLKTNHSEYHENTTRSSGFFSSKSKHTIDSAQSTVAEGSLLSGKEVMVSAGGNLSVTGSTVISDAKTALTAKDDILIKADEHSAASQHYEQTKKSGLFSNGGLSFTLGSQKQETKSLTTSTQALGSQIGSLNGDVSLVAGGNYQQIGSDLIAPQGELSVIAKRIEISEAREVQHSEFETRLKQSGLTLSISNPVISAIQTTTQMVKAASRTTDTRSQMLAGVSAGIANYRAYGAVQAGQGTTIGGKDNQIQTGPTVDGKTPSRESTAADKIGGINISISLGTSKSQSNSKSDLDRAVGSQLAAGGNINLIASGAGEHSNILIQGSDVAAGKNLTLAAENDILLLAAHNAASERSSNKSSSGSIGVSVGSSGLYVNVGASKGKGHGNGDDLWWNNTHLDAGNTLTLVSGGDTALVGAVAKGQQLVADIGGDLLIESLQDKSTFDAKQQNISGSLSVGLGSQGMISGSLSIDKSKVNSDFASVGEQSGLKAGDGGFDVTVKGDTTLIGAVIASTDKAVEEDKNRLSTATLTTSDLKNSANASADSSGLSLGTNMFTQGKYGLTTGIVSNLITNSSTSGHSSGTTQSAIEAGTVTITDEAAQQALTGNNSAQLIASLNRDTTNTHHAAKKQDVQAMEQQVAAELNIKQAAVEQVIQLTDEAYRTRFLQEASLLIGTCNGSTDQCVADPSRISYRIATEKEVAEAKEGAILAVSGINNDDERAVHLAYQNIKPDNDNNKPSTFYVVNVVPAQNSIAELLAVAYEKAVNSLDYSLANALGYTNATELYADLLRSRGGLATISLAHSRGTLTQESAFAILLNRSDYTNANLTIHGVGGAANADSWYNKAIAIQGQSLSGIYGNIAYNYFSNDPVSVFAGGNAGSWSLADLWQVINTSNSMHSCYGTGAAGCTQVEIPLPGSPHQGTPAGNALLNQYRLDENRKPTLIKQGN